MAEEGKSDTGDCRECSRGDEEDIQVQIVTIRRTLQFS